jgi:hypothetical protein
MSQDSHDPLRNHPALSPLGPQIAADDPDGRKDDWEEFKRRAKTNYPGMEISDVDEEAVRRLIESLRRVIKRKG